MKEKFNLIEFCQSEIQKEQLLEIRGGVELEEARVKCKDTCVGCGDASNKASNRKNINHLEEAE